VQLFILTFILFCLDNGERFSGWLTKATVTTPIPAQVAPATQSAPNAQPIPLNLPAPTPAATPERPQQ